MTWLMMVIVETPLLALVPAATFWLLSTKGGRVSRIAAVAWAAYACYEQAVKWRILYCSGDCYVRVDLVLIYPILLLLSVVAIGVIAYRLLSGEGWG